MEMEKKTILKNISGVFRAALSPDTLSNAVFYEEKERTATLRPKNTISTKQNHQTFANPVTPSHSNELNNNDNDWEHKEMIVG